MKIILSEEFWVLMADHNSVSLLAGAEKKFRTVITSFNLLLSYLLSFHQN